MKEHIQTLVVLQYMFRIRNNILLGMCQILLLQLIFDSVLNEKQHIFLHGLICPTNSL